MARVPALLHRSALATPGLGVKRILSLDGGGIFGVFSLQVLAAIEAHFREEHAREDLVLADVVDLFAGTSTGAIIATCLAWGMSVREIEALYLSCAAAIFTKQHWFYRWKTKYRVEPVTQLFMRTFTETPGGTEPALLGTARLRTLLLVVMRNASTGAPWPVTNNPQAKFNDRSLPDCNLQIPLWQLLRASTAAPSYFPPERIRLGEQSFLFMDGGMTAFNNPTLIAVLTATLPAYRVAWPTGREQLHCISVGTCDHRATLSHRSADDVNLYDVVTYLAPALIGASSAQQDLACRVLGDCVHGAVLDSELQALDQPSLLAAQEQKFTYVRYDQPFEPARVPGGRGAGSSGEMDDVSLIPALQQAGREYAARHVRRDHLYPRGSTR